MFFVWHHSLMQRTLSTFRFSVFMRLEPELFKSRPDIAIFYTLVLRFFQ